MLSHSSLTATGRLGTTPSDSNDDANRGTTRWYDLACVPFARSLVGLLQTWPTVAPEYGLLLAIAKNVQTFSVGPENDQWTTALRTMLLNGRHAGGKTFLSNHKAQVFTKYLLLQKVSATLRCQPWEIAPAERVQSVEKIHAKMKLVLKGAHRWPKIFQSVRAQVASLHDASTSTLLAPALGSFTDMGKAHLRGLKILHGARKSSRLSDYSIVESNVQYTAYMVHWHSTHNTPFPPTFQLFFQQLSEETEQTGCHDQGVRAFAGMLPDDQEALFASLKSCLDLAVHVSPLVLLGTVPGIAFRMLRSKLIQWGLDLGPKPDYIIEAERAIWTVIIGIALGQDASELLNWFVKSCSDQFTTLQANAENLQKFFVNGVLEGDEDIDAEDDVEMAVSNSGMGASGYEADVNMEDAAGASPGELLPARSPTPTSATPLAAPVEGTAGGEIVAADDLATSGPVTSRVASPMEDVDLTGERSPSPLSSLTSSESSDEESSEEEPGEQPATLRASSRRPIKVAAKFTSGVNLTQPSAPKKRKLELPGTQSVPMTVAEKEEELYWTTAVAHVTAAAADIAGKLVPSGPKTKKGKKAAKRPTPRSSESAKIPYFDESNDLPAQEYTFQPDAKSAKTDVPMVEKLVGMVRSKFINGQPPHWQPAASSPDLGPEAVSSIFRVDCRKFNAMTPYQIQHVFRDRHILVTGVDNGRPVSFDAEGLETLADLDEKVSLQYSDRKSVWNSKAMLEKGSLRELLLHGDSPVAINALDLPLGHVPVPFPASFTNLASDAHSVNLVKRLLELIDLSNVTSWATGSTVDATSWAHIDDDGFATSVSVQVGGKWWVLLRKKNQDPREDEMRDVSTFEGWHPDKVDDVNWEAEAVHLEPHCVLYMRPCTPHFVLGMAPSIVLGRHYYATSAIRRSCFGIVHTFVMGLNVTNTFHDDGTRTMLRQLMALYYRHFILHDGFDRQDAHVPDMRTQDGLLDVIALGCVLEYSTALSRARYHAKYDSGTDEECAVRVQENQARTWFRVIMKVFGQKHQILSGTTMVDASYVWHTVMVGFALAVVTHIKAKNVVVPLEPGVNSGTVETAFRLHLREDHPHLLPAFDAGILQQSWPCLTWPSTVPLEVIPKTSSSHHLLRALGISEQREIPDMPAQLSFTHRATRPKSDVNKYYTGVWPGEDLPNDDS